MTIGLVSSVRDARAQAILTAIDAGGAGASLKLFGGTRPGTTGGATAETPLVTITFLFPAGSVGAGTGTLSITTPPTSNATAGGTASWARIQTSAALGDNDFIVMDLSVTTTAGNGDIKLNSTEIISGGPVSIVSASITEGNA